MTAEETQQKILIKKNLFITKSCKLRCRRLISKRQTLTMKQWISQPMFEMEQTHTRKLTFAKYNKQIRLQSEKPFRWTLFISFVVGQRFFLISSVAIVKVNPSIVPGFSRGVSGSVSRKPVCQYFSLFKFPESHPPSFSRLAFSAVWIGFLHFRFSR